jgi:hypothetical protein
VDEDGMVEVVTGVGFLALNSDHEIFFTEGGFEWSLFPFPCEWS